MANIIEHPGMKAQTPLAVQEQTEVGGLIREAIQAGRDPGELMAVYREMVAMRARQQFSEALAGFRCDCPAIPRRAINNQFSVTVDGVKRPRTYADLEDIQSTIDPVLAQHGLTYRWGDATVKDGMMTISCILSHVGGHSESSSVLVPTESSAGASMAQKWMSAGTYGRRYSLIAVTGVKTADADDDGNEAGEPESKISLQDALSLADALIDVNANKPAFLKMFGISELADMPQAKLAAAWEAIERKRKAVKP